MRKQNCKLAAENAGNELDLYCRPQKAQELGVTRTSGRGSEVAAENDG